MPRHVLVVGAGRLGREVGQAVQAQRATGLTLVGFVDDDLEKRNQAIYGASVLGPVSMTPTLVETHDVDEVIFALPLRAHSAIERLVLALQEQPVRVRIVPDFLDLAMSRATVEDFNGLPLVGLRDPAIDGVRPHPQARVRSAVGCCLGAVDLACYAPDCRGDQA